MFVLDASITLRWFFEVGSHPKADAILGNLSSFSDVAVVPTIWRYEVSAVLARAQAKGSAEPQDVTDFLEDLRDLPIQTDTEALIFEQVHVVADLSLDDLRRRLARVGTAETDTACIARRRVDRGLQENWPTDDLTDRAGAGAPSMRPGRTRLKRCQSACKPGSVRRDASRRRT